MLLRAFSSTSAISLSTSAVDNVNQFPSSYSSVSFSSQRRIDGFVMSVSNNRSPVTGVVFELFEEVKKELQLVPDLPQQSIARHKFTDICEAAINEQINVEYNVSYVYHALYVYFDQDNVSLRGFAKFFKEDSVEEREHAELLMEYQNRRGGKVKLQSILMPLSEFDHPEKGDALHVNKDINQVCKQWVCVAFEEYTEQEKIEFNNQLMMLQVLNGSYSHEESSPCTSILVVSEFIEKWLVEVMMQLIFSHTFKLLLLNFNFLMHFSYQLITSFSESG
ncbi:hypothetical protein MKX03_028420 [Papaver bracteatum]|nr:hypothetical protein MKX03_028420 [Papaver bracteatum]